MNSLRDRIPLHFIVHYLYNWRRGAALVEDLTGFPFLPQFRQSLVLSFSLGIYFREENIVGGERVDSIRASLRPISNPYRFIGAQGSKVIDTVSSSQGNPIASYIIANTIP